ncbi:MAG TPA: Gfo/Idh/MocA family oxidoreductase, partial [Planctomycetota bacterium]|nr:Gfo/Idh/MocA family oxidoreductase [Planctomycetota bacterium]
GIDAVMIATPDHVHAVATLAAMRLGKHVYCEKPLTHTVEEARKVAEEARKSKVATQMGNQGNSSEGIRQVIEWVRAGVIGEVRELHAWSDAGGWAEGRTSAPKDSPPVPQGLDWDLWLGPVKPRAYHPAYAPYNWRGWWAFGGGAIGDMGCHNIDPAFAALELGSPDTIEASGVGRNPETSGWGSIIHYTFPARGEMPPVKLTWYDGGLKPPRPEEFAPGERFDGNGLLLVGSKGKLLCGGWSRDPRLLPASRMKEFEPPPKTLPRVSAHDRAWIDACKGGPKPSSSFEYGGALTEVVLLGAVALQVGEKIHWDGPNLRATNSGKVEELIRTEYRKGWSL